MLRTGPAVDVSLPIEERKRNSAKARKAASTFATLLDIIETLKFGWLAEPASRGRELLRRIVAGLPQP